MPRFEAAPDTPQWHAARRGCLTASRMADVMDRLKSGKPGADRDKYLIEIVAERMSGVAANRFVTEAMQWGIDHESDAILAYEAATGNMAKVSGFYLHDRIEFFGATPDREVDSDGLLEVKCPMIQTYVGWLRAGVVPEKHHAQMLAQLVVTGRKWCDFIAFDPRCVARPLFVRRYEPTEEQRNACEQEAIAFLKEVDEVFTFVTQG